MAANIQISQPTGAGAGSTNASRDDIWEGEDVLLIDVDGGAITRAWSVLDVSTIDVGSRPSIVNPTAATATLSGASIVRGRTYLLKLSRGVGGALGEREFLFRVKHDNTGALIPNCYPVPALNEQAYHSEGITGQGLTGRGYAPLLEALDAAAIEVVRGGWTPSYHTGATITLDVEALTVNLLDGTVTTANLPAISASNDGVPCVLTTGAGGGPVTVVPDGTDTVDDGATISVPPETTIWLMPSLVDGGNWYVMKGANSAQTPTASTLIERTSDGIARAVGVALESASNALRRIKAFAADGVTKALLTIDASAITTDTSTGVEKHAVSGVDVMTATYVADGATTVQLANTVQSFTWGWAQDPSGAGGATYFAAQGGAAGFANGSFNFGLPASNDTLGGRVWVGLGNRIGNQGDKFSIGYGELSALTSILDIYQSSLDNVRIDGGNNTLTVSSGYLNLVGTGGIVFDSAVGTIRFGDGSDALSISALSAADVSITAANDVLSFSIGVDQHQSGAGIDTSLRGQDGFTGFTGGVLWLGGGNGGTPGTNKAGPTRIQLGQLVSGESADFALFADSTSLLNFRRVAGPTLVMSVGSYGVNNASLLVNASNVNIEVDAAINFVAATTMAMVATDISFNVPSISIPASVASFTLSQTIDGSAAGGDMTIVSQGGASGFANGKLRLKNPSTNTVLGGGVIVDVGAPVANVSDPFAIETNGTRLLAVNQPSASRVDLLSPSALKVAGTYTNIESSAGHVAIAAASDLYIDSVSGIRYHRKASALSRTEVVNPNAATITSATTTTVGSFSTTSGRIYLVQAVIAASNDTDDEGALFSMAAAFKNVGGSLTQIGATENVAGPFKDAGQTGLTATIDASGTTIRVRLTTDSGDTVKANCEMVVHERVQA